MLDVVENYEALCKNLGGLIKRSGYKNVYIAEKIGIPPTNFSTKKKRGNWTIDEMKQIISIIDNEELDDYFMAQLMEAEKDSERLPISLLKSEYEWL